MATALQHRAAIAPAGGGLGTAVREVPELPELHGEDLGSIDLPVPRPRATENPETCGGLGKVESGVHSGEESGEARRRLRSMKVLDVPTS